MWVCKGLHECVFCKKTHKKMLMMILPRRKGEFSLSLYNLLYILNFYNQHLLLLKVVIAKMVEKL